MTTNVIQMPVSVPVWTFADRLRKVRREVGLGQSEFADALGMRRQAYAAWETGRNTPRDIASVVEQLERVTGVSRAWFLGWMDNGGPGTPGTPAVAPLLPHLDSNQEPSGSRPNGIRHLAVAA